MFVIKTFYSSVVPLSLWRDNIFESFLSVLHHPDTLSTGLLNSLKKPEMWVIKVAHMFARKEITRNPRKSMRRLAQQIEVSPSTA
jgi:hypothetical protein